MKRICFLILLGILFSCESEDVPKEVDIDSKSDIEIDGSNDRIFQELSPVESPPEVAPKPIGDPVVIDFDENLEYLEQEIEEAQAIPEVNLLDSKSDIFYPGSLFEGSSVLNYNYDPIVVKREPITISTSLNGANVRATVNDPKLSSVRKSINDLMTQEFNTTPANMSYDMTTLESEEQLRLALGASYEGGLGSIKGSFDFSKKTKFSRTIFKFKQLYYSLDLDLPQKPSDFFSDQLDPRIFKGKSPVYVSSVSYGRQVYLLIESSMSSQDVKAALQGVFSGSVGTVSANASVDFSKLSSTSSIKSVVIGGGSESASQNIGSLEDLKKLISEGGKFGKENPGVPLSYTLRSLKDNKKFATVIAAKYKKPSVRPRKPLSYNAYFSIENIKNSFNASITPNEIYIHKNYKNTIVDNVKINLDYHLPVFNINFEDGSIEYQTNISLNNIVFKLNNDELLKKYYDSGQRNFRITVQGTTNGVPNQYFATILIREFKSNFEKLYRLHEKK